MRDVIEVGTWAQPVAFVAVCATLVVLYLWFHPAKASAVRLRDAAGPKARAGRAWGPFWQGKSTGLPERFERMDGVEFEVEVSRILRDLGYSVRPTVEHPGRRPPPADDRLQGGCAVEEMERAGGHRSMYGLFTGRIHYGTDEAWLITTSRFTPKAVRLAETTGVRLVDGKELAEWLDAKKVRPPRRRNTDPSGGDRSVGEA